MHDPQATPQTDNHPGWSGWGLYLSGWAVFLAAARPVHDLGHKLTGIPGAGSNAITGTPDIILSLGLALPMVVGLVMLGRYTGVARRRQR